MNPEATAKSVKDSVIRYMDQTLLCGLTTLRQGKPATRMMLFGNDPKGSIYLCARVSSSILDEIRAQPDVALSIFREEVLLENMASISVQGRARIIENPAADENMTAYDMLGRKSPLLGDIACSDAIAGYRIIVVRPDEIVFQKYDRYQQGLPPVILRRQTVRDTGHTPD